MNWNSARSRIIKPVNTGGIAYIELLDGSSGWYWGTDYTSGDLYEAEELYESQHRISQNRLIFVKFPEGEVFEPVTAKEGQYFGRPVFDAGDPVILLADFREGSVRILRFRTKDGSLETEAVIPRASIEDCYNLMLHESPLTLTRQTVDTFQIVWPERAEFRIDPAETFSFREGQDAYFSRWYEDPDYREEVVVRRLPGGEIVDTFRGSLNAMPDGSQWLLYGEDAEAPVSACRAWAAGDPVLEAYHDEEWCRISHDDRYQFEMLCLEGASVGLSWKTVLYKRAAYRDAFHHFDIDACAAMTDGELEDLLTHPGLIRNRNKIFSVRKNAQAVLKIREEFGSFDAYLWHFTDGKQIDGHYKTMEEVPTVSDVSRKMCADMKKRGIGFVGPVITYSFLQSIGMVNDHLDDCRFR